MGGRVEPKVWGGVFFAFLCSAVVMGMLDLRPFSVATGAAKPAPELSADRAFDAEYYRSVDAYLIDRLAPRGLGTRARYTVDFELFGDSTSTLVHVGDNDTLFYAPYQTPNCASIADFAGFVDPVQSGVEVRYTVVAPKSAFYPDRLDNRNKPSDCVVQARNQLAERLAADPLAIPVDSVIADAADSGTEVFYRTDTHWSPVTRAIVAELIVESFAPDLWDPTLTSEADVELRGDLRRLLGAYQPETLTGPIVDRSPVTEIEMTEVGILLMSRHTTSTADAVVPGTTLIVGDSQIGYVLPLIDRYFEDLRFVNWIALDLRPNMVVPDADRVLFESIEFEATARFASASMTKVRDTLGI